MPNTLNVSIRRDHRQSKHRYLSLLAPATNEMLLHIIESSMVVAVPKPAQQPPHQPYH